MDNAWLKKRITATKTQIEQYEDAVTQLASGAIQSYTIDTGQTNQSVTKANLSTLRKTLEGLYNHLAVLEQRVYGNGSSSVRPDF